MKGISDRSEFIRAAIPASLRSVCPLCKGTGILTPYQKSHFNSFLILKDHSFAECEKCREVYLICLNKP